LDEKCGKMGEKCIGRSLKGVSFFCKNYKVFKM
jgi:hypothetical protein